MLVFVLVAVLILTSTAALHYNRHFRFRFQSCYAAETSVSTLPSAPPSLQTVRTRSLSLVTGITLRRQCCCVWKGIDDQNFDFFPRSFLFYVVFMIFLCVLICIIEILNYLHSYSDETVTDLLFGLSIKSYHDKSLLELHKIHLFEDEPKPPVIYALDLFLICGIMLLSIWESLFSFYRYYTTAQAMQAREISSSEVIKRFILYYAIVYCVVFIIEIAVYYYTFLVVVLLHLSFNVYCTWKFAGFLIEEYEMFISIEATGGVISGRNNVQILNSVIFMRRTSIVCCILQSISLSLFVIAYNPTIIYFLPILWSISCSIFALNFIRNRMFLRRQLFRINQRLKYKCLCCKQICKYKQKHVQKKKTSPNMNTNALTLQLGTGDSRDTIKRKSKSGNDMKECILDPNACAKEDGQLAAPSSIVDTMLSKKSKSDCHLLPTALALGPTHSAPVVGARRSAANGDANAETAREPMDARIPVHTIAIPVIASLAPEMEEKHYSPSYSKGVEYSYSATNRPKKTKKALELLGIHEPQPTQSAIQMQLGSIDVLQQQTSLSKSRELCNKPITPLVVEHKEMELDTVEYNIREEAMDGTSGSEPEAQEHVRGPVSVQELSEAIQSFKLFAKYGFLSNANINSAQQLKQYHHATHAHGMSADLFYTLDLNVAAKKENCDKVSNDLDKLTQSQSLPKTEHNARHTTGGTVHTLVS